VSDTRRISPRELVDRIVDRGPERHRTLEQSIDSLSAKLDAKRRRPEGEPFVDAAIERGRGEPVRTERRASRGPRWRLKATHAPRGGRDTRPRRETRRVALLGSWVETSLPTRGGLPAKLNHPFEHRWHQRSRRPQTSVTSPSRTARR
jgi:hypothetical protein